VNGSVCVCGDKKMRECVCSHEGMRVYTDLHVSTPGDEIVWAYMHISVCVCVCVGVCVRVCACIYIHTLIPTSPQLSSNLIESVCVRDDGGEGRGRASLCLGVR